MNSIHSRRFSVNSSRSRRALVQPRFLLAAMALSVSGVAFLAAAQTGRAPVKMTSGSGAASAKPKTLADLPALIEAYGQSRLAQKQKKSSPSSAPGTLTLGRAVGTGESGFNLVETDLTPNSLSDDREPVYSPGGDFIAFASNGKDSNRDGRLDSDGFNAERRYHIWVMNRDGSNQRQVTGSFDDRGRNQRRPSWSPDGNQLVYIDGDGGNSELFVADPFTDNDAQAPGVQTSSPSRRTFFNPAANVTLRSPVWSPGGQTIVFAANANLDNDAGVTGRPFNLFSISPTGEIDSIVRLTGGSNDPTPGTSSSATVDDLNPTFAVVNPNVIYFSSNRTKDGVLGVRRIWRMLADGSGKIQVTDPVQRPNGTAGDSDDYPAASLAATVFFGESVPEQVAFQTNTSLDDTDVEPNGARDLNVWALPLTSVFPGAIPPPLPPESRVFVSEFNGGRVLNQNPVTGGPNDLPLVTPAANLPEGVVVQNGTVYFANRGTNQILRFDEETGVVTPFSAPNSVPAPAGMISDGQFFYVAPGIGAAPQNTVAIYRFNFNGAPAGLDPLAPTNAGAFSFGEASAADRITNGTEGLAFSADNNRQYIYTANFSDNKVNVYSREDGRFIKTFVTPGSGGLNVPTDLTFGPDINKDTFQDLYVNSSGSDDVKAYAGPNPIDINALVGGGSDVTPGQYLGDVVTDNDGRETNLNAPEGIEIIQRDDGLIQIFVSSFQNFGLNSATGTGDHINRYTLDPNTIDVTNPDTLQAVSAPRGIPAPNIRSDARFITFPGARGLGYFDFNQTARDNLSSITGMREPTPTPTPLPPRTAPLEEDGPAQVQTNILSSPRNYAASGIAPRSGTDNVKQDKAPDVEPAFSRISSTPQLAAQLSFASTRRFAPMPSSNLSDQNGNAPTASNPFGEGAQGTFDIWATSTADLTPPALIPQTAGNQLYPVVAPGPQSPFPAPRTAEAGLRAGGNITVAVVLSELESAIDDSIGSTAVSADFFRAGAELFTPSITVPNERVRVSIQTELRPPVEQSLILQPYDDGPISRGGHEAQAGAVSGDGIYYCVGTAPTPTIAGDFYIDINATDRKGNAFTYDNVWGFSTQTFAKPSLGSNLFVSDYTAGQQFPFTLNDVFDSRFAAEPPVESYYLSNPPGQVVGANGLPLPPPPLPEVPANTVSIPTTFANADVWRILSRGPVPQTVLDAYKPRLTQQISSDPADDPTYTQRTREVLVADTFVIWAAPYAANSFVGPGTITDATTQTNLTRFLDAGGRLFVTGRDVAYALSNGATSSNDFLRDELGATFGGETFSNDIDLVGGIANGFIAIPSNPPYPDTYFDLQLARRVSNTDDYSDASSNQFRIDVINPVGGGTTPVYQIGNNVVGQKVVQTRANGLESRVVFFSFGLEGVNRRYRVATNNLPLVALDTRARIAAGLNRYFTTNGVRGRVVNDKTNLPIANFLVSVTGGGQTYLARTDANGNYELSGLPQGTYTAQPAFLLNGRLVTRNTAGAQTDPPGFFGGTAITFTVSGGAIATVNLRPIPMTPGAISGRIVTSKGTPDVFTDDLPLDPKAVGLTVLLRSTSPTSTTRNGGRYAQLVRTNFSGNFTFSNVPAGIALEVVFNPRLDDPATPIDEGDIPSESGLRSGYAGPKTNVGRRVIPDARRPEPVIAPVGATFILNDPDPLKFPRPEAGPAVGSADSDKPADSGVPIVVPEGANVSGVVTLNGTPFGGAIVELSLVNPDGTFTVRGSKTTTNTGIYSFTDVVAGTYVVKVSLKLPDGLEIVQSSPRLTVAAKGVDYNFNLFLAKVTGLVTRNGKPQEGASVQLLDANGRSIVLNQTGGPFTLVRTTTTDKGTKANYTLTNVPPGRYTVRASFGDASGSATVTVTNTRDAVAPTISLVPQNVTGVVNLRIDGASKGGLAGAEVELLNSSGNSLSPRVVTVSGANGVFGFGSVPAGSYKVRASYKGDTDISATFTLNAGATSRQTVNIDLQTVTVTVFGSQGAPQDGATVSLLRGTTVVQTATTGANGQVKFTEIAAGTYSVTATRGSLSQTVTVVVVERKPLSVSLQLFNTTFGLNGVFPISLPFATDGTGVTIDQAFNLPLSSKAYKIFFFDAARQINKPRANTPTQVGDFKEITSGSTKLIRGMGYVLQTFDREISTRTPMQNSALKPFDGLTFTIPLTWNNQFLSDTRELNHVNNGYNLIGFPFDPARFGSVNFADSQVMYGNTLYKTLNEAVAAGIISRQVYVLNSSGVRVTTSDSNFRPFVGYFVRILRNDQPIKLILRNPK